MVKTARPWFCDLQSLGSPGHVTGVALVKKITFKKGIDKYQSPCYNKFVSEGHEGKPHKKNKGDLKDECKIYG